MRSQQIFIEIDGKQVYVGEIRGNTAEDARFCYAEEYINASYGAPISISLPLGPETFSPEQTRNFFEGLLPEGFTRRTVAGWLHVDENDYISILSALGQECLGAIKIVDEHAVMGKAGYEKLTISQVKALAREGVSKSAELVTKAHLSLTGASGKVGLYYSDGSWLLPKADAPSTHIVKQSHVRLDSIVFNEQLSLMTARELGIVVPDSFIADLGEGKDEDVLFATQRYDRRLSDTSEILDGLKRPFRLHQEDFAQALAISSANKYEKPGESYLAAMFNVLRKHSADPIEDSLKLWDIVIFDFLIGNTDNHVKNHSLLYDENLKTIRLAPAYDIVSTSIYDSCTRDMAFHIGGKYSLDEIDRESFAASAEECGIGKKIALKHFDDLADHFEKGLRTAARRLMEQLPADAEALAERILKNGGYASMLKKTS